MTARLRWFHEDSRFAAAEWRCASGSPHPDPVEASPRPAVAFARQGVYRRHVGSEAVLIDPGSVVFYPQGMEYRVSHPLPRGDRSLVVTVNDETLKELGAERMPTGHVSSSPNSALGVRRVDLAAHDGARLAVEEVLLRLVREALATVVGDYRPSGRRRGTVVAHRRAVERAKAAMAERYAERLTLDDIARHSGYSAAHLCEVFRRETGLTIHRHLCRLRLRVALEGLDGQANLTRLAFEVGFSTPSHFSTAFRREFGYPPSRLIGALRSEDVARLRP